MVLRLAEGNVHRHCFEHMRVVNKETQPQSMLTVLATTTAPNYREVMRVT